MSIKITGTGSAIPVTILNNNQLSQWVETSDEWIKERTGIRERRILGSESLADIAIKAALKALESSGCPAKDIELIICSTVHGEGAAPALACIIQKNIGAVCPAFDINTACTGFLYALQTARSFIQSGLAKRVLVVAAEAMSEITDYTDRETCILFGDGAGAVLLEKGESLVDILLTSEGNGKNIYIPLSRGNCPLTKKTAETPYTKMNGKEVYKFAVNALFRDVRQLLESNNMTVSDIDYFLFHQANLRILETAREKLEIPTEKMIINIDRYGNTSSACIPVMLDESIRSGLLSTGDTNVLSAFGAGFTTGAAIIKI